jgi:3-hydroxyisobutyrate dehydrogenase-like beta-hydroxyacid dehydrogenase
MVAVSVVGLGAMGGRIAKRLVEAEHEVVVWNRTTERMVPLIDLGAAPAESPRDAAQRADVVITMVSDQTALEAVTRGSAGIAAGVGPATTVIDMSTVGPVAVAELAAALPAGTGMLDAPVLGSISEAEAGTLTIFVGGPSALLERYIPLLSALGSPMHVGPLGSGAASKLVGTSPCSGRSVSWAKPSRSLRPSDCHGTRSSKYSARPRLRDKPSVGARGSRRVRSRPDSRSRSPARMPT